MCDVCGHAAAAYIVVATCKHRICTADACAFGSLQQCPVPSCSQPFVVASRVETSDSLTYTCPRCRQTVNCTAPVMCPHSVFSVVREATVPVDNGVSLVAFDPTAHGGVPLEPGRSVTVNRQELPCFFYTRDALLRIEQEGLSLKLTVLASLANFKLRGILRQDVEILRGMVAQSTVVSFSGPRVTLTVVPPTLALHQVPLVQIGSLCGLCSSPDARLSDVLTRCAALRYFTPLKYRPRPSIQDGIVAEAKVPGKPLTWPYFALPNEEVCCCVCYRAFSRCADLLTRCGPPASVVPLLALVPPTVYAAPPYMGEIPPSQRRAIVPEAEVAAAVTSKQLAKFVLALVHLPPLCVSPGSSDVAAAAAPSAGDTAVRRRPLGMRAMCEACKTMRVSWLLYWRCDHPDYTDKDCWVLVGEFYPGYGGLIGEVSLQESNCTLEFVSAKDARVNGWWKKVTALLLRAALQNTPPRTVSSPGLNGDFLHLSIGDAGRLVTRDSHVTLQPSLFIYN